MAMKETENSLRAYFVIAGGYDLISCFRLLGELHGVRAAPLPATAALLVHAILFVGMAFGIGYVVAGIRLKRDLRTGARWIKQLLIAATAFLALVTVLVALPGADGATATGRVVGLTIGLAISVYLYRSVARLAAEAAARQDP